LNFSAFFAQKLTNDQEVDIVIENKDGPKAAPPS